MNSNITKTENDFQVELPCPTARSIGWVLIPEQAPMDDVGTETKYKTIRYDQFVEKLFKKDSSEDMALMHAALGVCGEAVELADAIKKSIIYGKPIDKANIVEELGDLRFYIQALMNILKIDEQLILNTNGTKLARRYKNLEYSNEAAIARADKPENMEQK